MKSRSVTALAVAIVFGLTACTAAEPAPTETTPQPSPTNAAPRPLPARTAAPTPAPPAPTPTAPVVEPEHALEITRTDAYELCKTKAIEFTSSTPPDPRDTYVGLSDSYVEAVDGIWRVWIPGVAHIPNQGPGNVAMACTLNGYIDAPTWFGYGGVATDFVSDKDAYFDESLQFAD